MPSTAQTTFNANRLIPIYDADDALCQVVTLADGTYVKGTVLGEVSATPGTFKAYATANVDGSQVAKGILQYDCVALTGRVTFGTAGGGGPFGETELGAPVYFSGTFRTAELTGLDAGAVTNLGRLISGTITAGIVRLG